MQNDFSAAFDRVGNYLGILFKLGSVGVRGSVLSVFTQFLSNWLKYVVVDGCRSNLVNVAPGMFQGSVFVPAVVPPAHLGVCSYTREPAIWLP